MYRDGAAGHVAVLAGPSHNIAYGPTTRRRSRSRLRPGRRTWTTSSAPCPWVTTPCSRTLRPTCQPGRKATLSPAFLADPPILILDGRPAPWTPAHRVLIQQAMARLRQDRTSFVIAHRLLSIDPGRRRDPGDGVGRIIEQGTHRTDGGLRFLLRPVQQPVPRVTTGGGTPRPL